MSKNLEYNPNMVRIFSNILYLIQLLSKSFFFILIIIIVSNIVGLAAYFGLPDKYYANSSIIVEEKSGGGVGSLVNMAAQFGMAGNSSMDAEKVGKLIITKAIMYPALLEYVTIDGVSDIVANHYINYKLRIEGSKIKLIENDSKSFSNYYNNYSLFQVYSDVVSPRTGVIYIDINDEGIIAVNINTNNELVSYNLNNAIVKSIGDFYKNKTKVKELNTIDILSSKLDSIETEMNALEHDYAVWKQKNMDMLSIMSVMEDLSFKRRLELLNAMYLETYKTLEFKKVNVQFEDQYIRVVDFPTLPLLPANRKIILYLIVSTLIGIVFSSICIVIRQVILDLNKASRKLEV